MSWQDYVKPVYIIISSFFCAGFYVTRRYINFIKKDWQSDYSIKGMQDKIIRLDKDIKESRNQTKVVDDKLDSFILEQKQHNAKQDANMDNMKENMKDSFNAVFGELKHIRDNIHKVLNYSGIEKTKRDNKKFIDDL